MYLYIYKEFKIIFNYILWKLLRCFCVGRKFRAFRVFGLMGGYLKKGCFIALFYRFSNGLIQTGFEHERLKG